MKTKITKSKKASKSIKKSPVKSELPAGLEINHDVIVSEADPIIEEFKTLEESDLGPLAIDPIPEPSEIGMEAFTQVKEKVIEKVLQESQCILVRYIGETAEKPARIKFSSYDFAPHVSHFVHHTYEGDKVDTIKAAILMLAVSGLTVISFNESHPEHITIMCEPSVEMMKAFFRVV